MKYKYRFLIYLILLITALLLSFCVGILISHLKIAPEPSQTLSGCFYYQPRIPYYSEFRVLGTAVGETLYKIIKCESGFDPTVCNQKYGCSSGAGLCQFIKSTWLETIERMGELLPEHCRNMEAVFDGECNLTACKWLYKTDGDVHWREWSGNCYLK